MTKERLHLARILVVIQQYLNLIPFHCFPSSGEALRLDALLWSCSEYRQETRQRQRRTNQAEIRFLRFPAKLSFDAGASSGYFTFDWYSTLAGSICRATTWPEQPPFSRG